MGGGGAFVVVVLWPFLGCGCLFVVWFERLNVVC